METQTQINDKDLDSWDNFISGSFLKADDVKSGDDAYVCVNVETTLQDEKVKIRLNLQRNEKDWDFDLNKTNAKKLRDLGISNPRAVIGKKIYFKKALVRSPKTNQEVESLRIWKVE